MHRLFVISLFTALVASPCPAAAASPSSGNSAAVGPSRVELAKQILADQTLQEVHRKAQGLLKGGLNAGSGYGEIWIRDLNTFIEVALEVNPPQSLREALLTFFKFQGANGDIVDGYIPAARATAGYAYRTSALATNLMAHKNTVETDQESSLVQAVRKYVSRTGDATILQERIQGGTVRERLGNALRYVLTERFDPAHGLVWGGTTADWGDVQPESPWGVEMDANSHKAPFPRVAQPGGDWPRFGPNGSECASGWGGFHRLDPVSALPGRLFQEPANALSLQLPERRGLVLVWRSHDPAVDPTRLRCRGLSGTQADGGASPSSRGFLRVVVSGQSATRLH